MADNPITQASPASVGYRRPPAGSRFHKGRSGNPAGRPKGSRNRLPPHGERLRSLMLEEAYRPIKVTENGKEITMPMAQAVFRALAAAKGEARAQLMFLKVVSTTEDEVAAYEQMLTETQEPTAREPVQIIQTIVDPQDVNR